MTETFVTSTKGLRVNTRRAFIQKVVNGEILFSIHTYYEFKFKLPKYLNTAKAINTDRKYQVIRVEKELQSFIGEVMKITMPLPQQISQKTYKVEWYVDSVVITYSVSGVLLTKEQVSDLNSKIKALLKETLSLIKLNCIEYKNETGISWRGLPKVSISNVSSSG